MSKSDSGSFSSTIHRIAVISISISLAALIIAFFVLFGFKENIRDKVYSLSGHLMVNKYTLSSSYEDAFIRTSDSLLQQISAFDEVDHSHEFILKAGLIKTDEEVQGIIMKGIGPDFDTAAFRPLMVAGSFPDFSPSKYSTDVAISQYMSKLMRLDVGEQVTLFFLQEPPRYRRITISGIYTTGLEEFDEKIIYGDIDLIRRINNWEENLVSGLEIRLKSHQDIDRMEEVLFNELPIELNVISANRQYPQIFEWLELLNRNVLILLIVILVVAAMGMVSMVLILIMERTKMIGMMKALGAENAQLRQVFLYSGLNLIVKGLLFGNAFGLLICWIQYQFHVIPLDVSNYYMHFVPILFEWKTLVGLNALMILLVGLALFIPIRVVSGVQPVQAIRFD